MNNMGFFEFTLNQEKNTAIIKREFTAGIELVWEAWTNPEILDQWWAPKPYQSITKHMDFKVGGYRFYAMATAEGMEIGWSIQDYRAIYPKTNIQFLSFFADKDQNRQLPGSEWDVNFSEVNGKTMVQVNIYNESRERMEKMIEMGFKEGFTSTLNDLENLLQNFKR